MSESHTGQSGALVARLISVSMEIDDDDRDVINVLVEVSNEASIPMGQLEPLIETSEGTSFTPTDAITSIGPGLSRTYEFNFSIMGGDWNFRLWHNSASGRRSVDIGPHHSEFTLKKADPTRTPKSSMGAGLFGGAFDLGMDTFGSTSERELIDSKHIELVEYEAEHDEGGSTRINVLDNESTAPLSAPLAPISPIEPLVPLSAPSELPEPPIATPTSSLEMPTGPPQAPPAGPPQAPPTGPPQAPPTGPPQAPPAGPPQAPPAGPPQAPQTPPANPPDNDPMSIIMAQTNSQAPPTGPPQEEPTNSPTGPPAAPPSGPPSAPPTGPPSGPPQN
ncbi:MAG: hypothetical protein HN696_07035 [Euryarchaeota archaeon]|nr:hypothetical protein [Euryarchaeota archaeon]